MVKTPIRTIVVDDYEPWRQFVRSTLATREYFKIIGEFVDGYEAIHKAKELRPELVLLDVSLPTVNGIDVARRIRQVCPSASILFISENRSREITEAAINVGAGGYLVKSEAANDLLVAITAVLEGKRFISASLAGHWLRSRLPNQSAGV